ncbi:MAG: sodium:solute symporter family protein [bacterium]
MLGIGVWCSRTRIGGVTDYLLAGRRLGVVMTGGAEYGFKFGASGVWYGVSTGVGLLMLGFLTAGRFRRLALFTVPDYLAGRYGGKTIRVLGAVLSLVALVGILAAQVNAAGRAFAIMGLGGMAAPLVAVCVFIAYTTLGGLWAATLSDLIQLAIASVGVIAAGLVVVAGTADSGGFVTLLQAKHVGPAFFNPVGEGPSFVLWLLLPTVMYTLIGQDFYQRLFAAKSARTARTAAFAGGLFLVVVSVFPVLIGMGTRGLPTGDIRPDEALPWVLTEMMHPVVGGFILAAVLAAVMSTADSLLTAATSHVVKDIWLEALHSRGVEDERRLLGMSRWVTIAIGLCALLIGVSLPGIVTALIYSYTMYTAGVLVPVLGGVLWKRGTRAGAVCAVVAGSVVALAGLLARFEILGVPAEIYAALVSAVVFVGVSLVTTGGRGDAGHSRGVVTPRKFRG